MSNRKIGISAIGTNVGKTVVSAILCEALNATYWKPIQAGSDPETDTEFIEHFCGEKRPTVKERYFLKEAASPHQAAKNEGIEIQLSDFTLPIVSGNLVVEGAGGLLVPINEEAHSILDMFQKLDLEVILVINYYLGSINHTLLSLELLKARDVKFIGIIESGDVNLASREIIQKAGGKFIFHVPKIKEITTGFIKDQAKLLKQIIEFS